ncbi:MAG TPA: MFS transporter, partial [Dongiaceae bacterium]|nr:MFS transporter [Dongiaceae bacterium]
MTESASADRSATALPRWRVFPALALGTVMATLDISVVNIALPTLSRRFAVSLTTIEWVVLAYVLTITGLLLTLGRISDAVGRRRVYGIGLLLFVAASALCAAASSAHALIAARAFQGLGAAMMTANASALLIASFDPSERGRALGAFGAVVGVGLALGPPFGGLVIEHLSWRWIFAANLPLGLGAFALLRARVPPDVPGERPRIDPLAAALWSAALIAVLLALSRGPDQGWGAPSVWGGFVTAAVLLAAFVALQARAVSPLLPRDLRTRPFAIGLTLTLIGQALSIAVGFQMPQFLENVWEFSAAASGRWLAVLPMAALVLAPMAGRWSDRFGTRPLTMTGMALTSAGLATLALLGVAPRPWVLVAGLALVGIGQGLFAVANSSAILSTAPPARLGVASGLQATMRNLGIASGSAVTTALVASRFATHSGQRLAAAALTREGRLAFANATHDAYLALAAVALIAAGLAAAT